MQLCNFLDNCQTEAAAVSTAGGIVFMGAMASILNRDFPPGLLQYFIELPWPLT